MGSSNDDLYSASLALGLGFSDPPSSMKGNAAGSSVCTGFESILTLGLAGEAFDPDPCRWEIDVNKGAEECSGEFYRQASPPHSANSVKRERDACSEECLEVDKVCSRGSDEDEDGSNSRKKLRLTKDQSALLEESFKQHSTLNPKQKQALARELNLRPRQVEVWFQNRRARTKLKQTEVDCEFLKNCCETLTEENRRLQKEVKELKALKLAQPFYMQLPAATLNMCPSCERIGGGRGDVPAKTPFKMPPKQHFFNPFANPSAAC